MTVALAVALAAFAVGLQGCGATKCNGRFYNLQKHPKYALLPTATCGENHADRIIGGQAAALGEFPWMTRIGYMLENCTSPTEFRCGGALINEYVVITAAHCATKLPSNRCKSTGSIESYYVVSVRLGEHVIETDPDCEQDVCAAKVQDIEVAQVIVHPQYDTPRLRHDIAILKLKGKAVYNGWVNALCLVAGPNIRMERFLNHTGIVAGWGITNTKTLDVSKVLMKLYVPIVPIERCIEAYDKRAELSLRTQVCAGGIQGQDSCSGDSGGPLFVIDDAHNEGPKYRMLGIVSFGFKRCAEKPLPAVYTNMLFYGKWIMDNL